MRMRGLTMVEVVVLVAIAAIGIALLLPLIPSRCYNAKRTQCASNIRQLLTAMYMYSDSPASGGFMPTLGSAKDSYDQKESSAEALQLLYRQYVNDSRIYACPESKMRPSIDELRNLAETDEQCRLPAKRMTPAQTSYSYDPGHANDLSSMVALIADDRGVRRNSDNHGPNKGQNVGFGTSVEFRESAQSALDKGRKDPNIFGVNSGFGSPITRREDSYLRP